MKSYVNEWIEAHVFKWIRFSVANSHHVKNIVFCVTSSWRPSTWSTKASPSWWLGLALSIWLAGMMLCYTPATSHQVKELCCVFRKQHCHWQLPLGTGVTQSTPKAKPISCSTSESGGSRQPRNKFQDHLPFLRDVICYDRYAKPP